MAKKQKKNKPTRNKFRDAVSDYYMSNRQVDRENRRRQEEEGGGSKGLKNLNTMEKTCVIVIVLGLIGIVIKYVVL